MSVYFVSSSFKHDLPDVHSDARHRRSAVHASMGALRRYDPSAKASLRHRDDDLDRQSAQERQPHRDRRRRLQGSGVPARSIPARAPPSFAPSSDAPPTAPCWSGRSAPQKFRAVHTELRKMQFLYADGSDAHFMDTDSYEQIAVPEPALAESLLWAKPGDDVGLLFIDGQPADLHAAERSRSGSHRDPARAARGQRLWSRQQAGDARDGSRTAGAPVRGHRGSRARGHAHRQVRLSRRPSPRRLDRVSYIRPSRDPHIRPVPRPSSSSVARRAPPALIEPAPGASKSAHERPRRGQPRMPRRHRDSPGPPAAVDAHEHVARLPRTPAQTLALSSHDEHRFRPNGVSASVSTALIQAVDPEAELLQSFEAASEYS